MGWQVRSNRLAESCFFGDAAHRLQLSLLVQGVSYGKCALPSSDVMTPWPLRHCNSTVTCSVPIMPDTSSLYRWPRAMKMKIGCSSTERFRLVPKKNPKASPRCTLVLSIVNSSAAGRCECVRRHLSSILWSLFHAPTQPTPPSHTNRLLTHIRYAYAYTQMLLQRPELLLCRTTAGDDGRPPRFIPTNRWR